MNEVDAVCDAPKLDRIRYEAKQRPHATNPADDRGAIRAIDLHDRHFGTFALQQLGQLPRLVGHPAGGWRQRTDERDLEAGEIHWSESSRELNTAR